VLEVDIDQKRISLSMKSSADSQAGTRPKPAPKAQPRKALEPTAEAPPSSPFDVLKSLKR